MKTVDCILRRRLNGMKQRCGNPNNTNYKHYGGRGVSVCEEWRNSFEAFKDWALANGFMADLSIDRIDVDGDYCPENCRWVSAKVQANNRRNTPGYIRRCYVPCASTTPKERAPLRPEQTITLSNEQAASIAAVILPMIRGYVDSHRDEYDRFLTEWNAKKQREASNNT